MQLIWNVRALVFGIGNLVKFTEKEISQDSNCCSIWKLKCLLRRVVVECRVHEPSACC